MGVGQAMGQCHGDITTHTVTEEHCALEQLPGHVFPVIGYEQVDVVMGSRVRPAVSGRIERRDRAILIEVFGQGAKRQRLTPGMRKANQRSSGLFHWSKMPEAEAAAVETLVAVLVDSHVSN